MTATLTWPARSQILETLDDWLGRARWYPSEAGAAQVIHYTDLGSGGRYRILVVAMPSGAWIHIPLALEAAWEGPGVAGVTDGGVLVDATYHPGFLRAWLRKTHAAGGFAIRPDADALVDALAAEVDEARPLGQEQSNTSVILPGAVGAMIKFLRVLSPGANPEIDVPLALTRAGFDHVPAPLGYSELMVTGPAQEARSVCTAIVTELLDGAEDGFLREVESAAAGSDPSADAHALGRVTRGLHDHLLDTFGEGEPMLGASLAKRIHAEARLAMAAYPPLAADADTVAAIESALGALQALGALPPSQRIHGDYHLGQTLHAGGTWYVLDFEGEPLRPLEERVAPDQRLRDVAGMIRSFDYARARGGGDDAWYAAARASFLDGYFAGDPSPAQALLLSAFILEKTLYEIRYEAQHRPEWVTIPYEALRHTLDALADRATFG